MRRLSFISLILSRWRRRRAAAGAGPGGNAAADADAAADANAATRPAAGSDRRRPRRAQPVRADRPGALHRRPREQYRRRPGALSALPGRPRRAALLRLPLFVRASLDGAYTFDARANNVGWRDQEYFGNYNRVGKLSVIGSWQQIPQFYSVDTMTPYTGTGGTLLLDDATQRATQNGQASTPTSRSRRSSTCASGATSAASTWSRRRRRTSTSRPASPRRSTAASCRGVPASGSATTSRWPFPTSRAPTISPSAPSGRTRRTCCASPTAGRGSTISRHTLVWDSPLRLDDVRHAGARPHVPVAVQLGADDQLRRVHQVGAQDAAHWLLLLRLVEQRRAAAAVHHQFHGEPIPLPRANTDAEAPRLLDEPEPDVAPHDRLAVRRALPQLHLRQSHAGDQHHAVHQLRLGPVDDARRAVRISMPTTGPRSTATRRGAGDPARAHRWLHAQRQRLRLRGSSSRAARTCFACSADAVGSSWPTFRAQYEFGGRTGSGLDETP